MNSLAFFCRIVLSLALLNPLVCSIPINGQDESNSIELDKMPRIGWKDDVEEQDAHRFNYHNGTKRLKRQQSYDSEMATFGEVPLSILQTRHAIPITFSGNAIYNKLHGMNIKLISALGSSSTFPTRRYDVIARPFIERGQGGWRELLAFYVDRTIGLFRIPNVALQKKSDHIVVPDWGLNITDQMVTQSYLKNVSLLFVEGWTSCYPSPNNTSSLIALSKSHLKAKRNVLWMNFSSFNVIPVEVDTSKQFIICPRNFSVYDRDWADFCLKQPSSVLNCSQNVIAQLTEMFVFDLIIANGERLQPNSRSNNVHVINYQPRGDHFFAVYIDQGHHTFEAGNEKTPLAALEKLCVFPLRLMRLLGRIRGKLSEHVKQGMGDAVVRSYSDAIARKLIGEAVSLDRLLSVSDSRMEALFAVARGCHDKHGGLFVM